MSGIEVYRPRPLARVEGESQLLDLWLHQKSPHTAAAYRRDWSEFRAFLEGKPIAEIDLTDLVSYARALASQGYAIASQRRKLAAVRSLLGYAHRLGLIPVNAGAALPVPKLPDGLAQRIAPEQAVLLAIASEPDRRNRLIVKTLYATGARVSELVALRWDHCQGRKDGTGQLTLCGKGGKTRQVLVSPSVWADLAGWQAEAGGDRPFPLSRRQIARIVAAAGARVGLEGFSPHWLRHAHASHALDRGASIALVQASLGHASIATTGRYLHARPTDGSGLHLGV